MSEESEDKQRTAQRLSALSSIFGKGTVPSTLADLINFNKRPRRRRSVAPMRIVRSRIKENPEFKIVGRQVPDIESQVRTDVLQNLSDVEPKMVEPRLKRMSAELQDLRRTLAPAVRSSKGTFVTVKTKLGRTKKTRIT